MYKRQLQDCDYLINYDIHWNPVRIIQRFGRIDRIGSRNAYIQLVNFWPNMTLDLSLIHIYHADDQPDFVNRLLGEGFLAVEKELHLSLIHISTEAECCLFCCPILLSRCRFCNFLKLLSYQHTANARPLLEFVQNFGFAHLLFIRIKTEKEEKLHETKD